MGSLSRCEEQVRACAGLWARDGNWEEQMTAGEVGVGFRENGYGYNHRKHSGKVSEGGSEGERQACTCVVSRAEGLAR